MAIKGYQHSLSRLWPDICKYSPSCSHYMIHAVANRGLIFGVVLGSWRILRCNPLAQGGYDPPPGYDDLVRKADQRSRQH